MINNMISISLDGKPCVSKAYSVLFIYNSITLILVRVKRKSLIRKTLILIRVPFDPEALSRVPVPFAGSPDHRKTRSIEEVSHGFLQCSEASAAPRIARTGQRRIAATHPRRMGS